MAGFYNCLIFWNGYILFIAVVGRLVCSVILLYIELYKLHWNVYILFIVGVVFAGTLVSSVELSYTGMCVLSLLWVWSFLVNWFLP